MRRTLDLVVSTILCVVAIPVVVIAAVGSAFALRAWPFFSQERVGLDGRRFRFLKIRTLPTSVPAYTDKYSLRGHEIPRFCRLLRDLHLDELPQLLLVVRGTMTLVGPRPEMPFLHDDLDPTFAAERTAVQPGCTGLWQLSVASAGLIADHPEYDAFHLANRSARFDAWIFGQTIMKFVRPRRRLRLADVPANLLVQGARPFDAPVPSPAPLSSGAGR